MSSSFFAIEDVVDVGEIVVNEFAAGEASVLLVDIIIFIIYCLKRILTRECVASNREAEIELDVVERSFLRSAQIREEPLCSHVLLKMSVEVLESREAIGRMDET